jgi:NADH-quinone oxidoreductase subunit H
VSPALHADVWAAPLIVGTVLAVGAYLVAVLDAAATRVVAGTGLAPDVLIEPLRRAALLVVQQRVVTERPDAASWALAPAAYAGLAAAGLAVVPWSPSFSVADVDAGIVVWGTVESLAVVAVFLHGWSPNSHQPLMAAYRYVAVGLSCLLVSMFVLIAVALPAESLALNAIVDAQAGLWNVVRHPLGLPLFAVVALGITFWGPMDLADGADLSGGTSAEASGSQRLAWQGARAAMLVSFAALGSAAFLGGWHGPVLPGPVWMAAKTAALLALLVAAGHLVARVRAERFVTWCWTVLLPLAFLDLVVAGLGALP